MNDRKATPDKHGEATQQAATSQSNVVLNISDIISSASSDESAEMAQVNAVLQRYMTELRGSYNRYRTLGAMTASSAEHNARCVRACVRACEDACA